MKKPTLNEHIDSFKTSCCNVSAHRKSRANYRCQKCGNDVSLEFHFYVGAILEDAELHEDIS